MSSSHAQGRGLTRNRERLACIECRRRKLKCDRQLPCSACKRRGDPKCVFQRYTNGSKGKSKDVGRQALEERLLRLEQIAQQVTPQRGFADSFDVSASGQGMPPGNGRSRQGQDVDECMDDVINDGVIKGATHWASVWKDIHELRLAITNENDSEPTTVTTITNSSQPNSSSCIGIVFGQTTPMSMNHILAQYLPPRKELDRYISAYFKSQIISASIHAPQFQRLYHRLWEEPLNMPPLWMSILFSMCDIASNSVGSGKSAVDQPAGFPYAAARCLVMGHYYRPQPWGPEALTLFAQARCLSDAILSPDVAPLLCLAAKVATRMGYHRRPETLSMTSFAAEMRRRTWASLTQIDLLTSFHLGLPPSTTVPVTMVDLPRNLNDSDFDEDSLEVPPSRALEEPTNVQFMIAKQRFMGIFDKILRTALESQQDLVSLNKVQTLHDEVESLFATMPDKLKPKLMTDSVFDPVNLIITRLCVMFIYAKSLIVLHRPHVLLRRPESIMSCYSASKMLTEGLCDAYHEFCPGGQVNSDPWFISGLTWHDFMLGAVALCLSSLVGQRSLPAQIDAEATYNLLYNISNICTGQGDTRGNETKRVQQIVEATMTHLRNGQGQEPLQDIGNVNAGNSDAFGEGWLHNMPEPMEDSLWDEYMGQYLNLELLLS